MTDTSVRSLHRGDVEVLKQTLRWMRRLELDGFQHGFNAIEISGKGGFEQQVDELKDIILRLTELLERQEKGVVACPPSQSIKR